MLIKLLDKNVSSKIAAGEVIERPDSVVKELLENSIDAGSSQIFVDIRGGGLEEINVSDNGSGIEYGQVALAFERFATSKLNEVQDLDSLNTLGFRGEALPSIAAVSDLIMVTKTESSNEARRINLRYGEVVEDGIVGSGTASTLTVRNLFENFPGRLKFLRSKAGAATRIQKVVSRYAMAYPGIRFRLSIEGRESINTLGGGDLVEVVSNIYGLNVAHGMIKLPVEDVIDNDALVIVSGMVGSTSITRSNRNHINTFINGRWVQNRMLTYSVQEAYKGFLMERRFPIAIIGLTIRPDQLDVNVHPSKIEVRFKYEGQVFSALQQSIKSALVGNSHVVGIKEKPVGRLPSLGEDLHFKANSSQDFKKLNIDADKIFTDSLSQGVDLSEGTYFEVSSMLHRSVLPALRVLGQINKTYIVTEGPDGIYLIDQHAAHERILFENIINGSSSNDIQQLLDPVVVNLDPKQQEVLNTCTDRLYKFGFKIEEFGENSYIIRGVSHFIVGKDPSQALKDLLETIGDSNNFENWEESAAYSLACHGAIRAGDSLSNDEMYQLTKQLESCSQPQTCPHGRPTMIHLTNSRLEREFGRKV